MEQREILEKLEPETLMDMIIDLNVALEQKKATISEIAPHVESLVQQILAVEKENKHLSEINEFQSLTIEALEQNAKSFDVDWQAAKDQHAEDERERYKWSERIEKQAEWIRKLQDFIKSIHDNYDCDSDQHKYHNGVGCRCCDAKKLLG